jgi:hypothetical protein
MATGSALAAMLHAALVGLSVLAIYGATILFAQWETRITLLLLWFPEGSDRQNGVSVRTFLFSKRVFLVPSVYPV